MSRLIPYPLLAFALFAMWLLLTQTLSPGQLLLGAAVAVVGSRAMAALRPQPSRIRSARALLLLAGVVAGDIIRSNFAVAAIILFPRPERVSGFVQVYLELRDPHGLALLALIITATPGTVWVDFDRRLGLLRIHVLDLDDEEHWARMIRTRYEARLLEAFGS